ncbi:MAG: Ger(x)C family spore germination C-terminal domain-containing protein, partial [Mycobacterium leprae]
FKGGTWVGSLNADETRLMMMLRGEFRRASMGLTDPLEPERRIVFRLGPRTAPKVTVDRQGKQVTAHFRIFMDGDMMSVQSQNDYTRPALKEKLEVAVEQELEQRMAVVLNKTLNQWAVDVFRIDDRLKATVRTWGEWESLDWGRSVAQTRYTVDVSFRMRRFGLQTQPSQPRE